MHSTPGRVAPDHDRGTLDNEPVALPQRHIVAPRQIDQFCQRAMTQPSVGRMGDRPRFREGKLGLHCGVDHHPFEIAGRQRPGLCATDGLSWSSATSCSSPSRWRQCVNDERSNGSRWQKLSSPQKDW
jgi:hypothetical protein